MLTFLENVSDKQYLQAWAVFSTIIFITSYRFTGRQLNHIPAIGSSSQIFSFIGAFQFTFNARGFLHRGCEKYRNAIFRVPKFDRWMVIIHGSNYIEEIKKIPENKLSVADAHNELLQSDFTLGSNVRTCRYHVPIIRNRLTPRNLDMLFLSLHKELVEAFNEVIPTRANNEWLKLKAVGTMMSIICRASNTIFVGTRLCRNPDYLEINLQFAAAVARCAASLRFVPLILKPIVAPYVTGVYYIIERCMNHLQPLIDERRRKMAEYDNSDYPDKPNDVLSWLIDEAQGDEATIFNLSRRILALGFAAIHPSTMTFCHALYYLAEYPEHARTLREEVQEIVDREEWSYAAVCKMVKVDSFIRESQRLNPISYINMHRIVREPFTFSDGTHLPKGTFVAVASHAIHLDENNYRNATSFEPFRFVDKTKKENAGRKVDLGSTNIDFLPFGHGRRACPGRFFVAIQLKLMLAHIVMNYDVKLEGAHPENVWNLTTCLPNPAGEVLFRQRATRD